MFSTFSRTVPSIKGVGSLDFICQYSCQLHPVRTNTGKHNVPESTKKNICKVISL